jgi:RNA polymerase sigma-70 factor (ECF subfamily)
LSATETPQSLLQEHWPLLVRIARSYARDPARCDDIVQEIAIAVWRALPRWRGEGSQRAFVARVAHNRALDALAMETAPMVALDESLPDPGSDPVHYAHAGQQREDLLAAVRRLPLGRRQVVVLALEGFSQREIGQAMGLEENAVAQRLSRARRELRASMGAVR